MSTSDALVEFMNNVYDGLNRNLINVSVFIDFKKAFDTISHNILFEKLQHYGIRGIALNWLISYLHDRSAYTVWDGEVSVTQRINIGVPQGTIIGPLLFLIYINDIVNASKVLKFILYADDTTLYISDSSLHEIIPIFNVELNHILNWTQANRISLNLSKTKYMIISTVKVNISGLESLILDGNKIERVNMFKFLGIIIDDRLLFRDHVIYTSAKLSRTLGILRKLYYLPERTLLTLYYSLFNSVIMYGILIWGSSSKVFLNKILVAQKKNCQGYLR